MAKRYNIKVDFRPFIEIQGVSFKDFRKQKINILDHTAIIFTSRNAVDHFFRICKEARIEVPADMKYFCITEAVALYLQKFILYRKRKVFYGADGTNKSLFDVVNKHKGNERFLYPCSENLDNEITTWLRNHNCEFETPILYKTVSNDVKDLVTTGDFDIICFFTPSGVKSLIENLPKYKQNGTFIGAFGVNTFKAVEEAGLQLQIKAPDPQAPSMVSALDKFLAQATK